MSEMTIHIGLIEHFSIAKIRVLALFDVKVAAQAALLAVRL